MFKLRRMRLDSIGSNSARFVDLTLDFTDTEADALDTIVWLRNGGGKTSLLALFFSLYLPNQRDFLGAGEDRKTLGDYVLTGDTGHVVCEWDTPSGPLVTAAVYEWPERHRPIDHEKHAGELNRRWYAFNPKPGVLSFDELPYRDDVRRRRNLDAYARELRVLGKANPLTGLVVTANPPEWKAGLLQRGIDPAVFLYQKKMNKGEGAIDEQFRFPNGEAFVTFLIDMVVDAEASESVSSRMVQLADKLGRRPATEIELEYCEGVAERLGPVAATWSDLQRAEADQVGALTAARHLAVELRGAHLVADEAERAAEARRVEAATRRTAAETARTAARERAREYQRRAVEFWVSDATARIEDLEDTQMAVEAEQAGWRALEDIFHAERAEKDIAEIDRRLKAKATEAEPLRLARNDAACRLHWRYVELADDANRQRDEARARGEELSTEAGRLAEEAAGATHDAGRHEEQIRFRREELASLDAALVAARDMGHLEVGEDAAVGLARATGAAEDVVAGLARLEAQIVESTIRQNDLFADRTAVGAEITRVSALRDTDDAEHGLLADEAEVLADHERVRELAQSDHVALWGAAPMLDGRLGEEIDRADSALVSEEVQAGRDRRNRDALGEDGLLPPSEDTDAICGVLADAGVSAVAGLAYLASSVPRRDWESTMSAHPGLLSGVLVDAGDLALAHAAVIEAGLHPGSLVTVAKKSDLSAAGEDTFVVPPSPALYDKAQAEEERKVLDRRLAELDQRTGLLVTQREADRQLRDRLRRFLEACPHGHLDTLARRIEEHENTLAQLEDRRLDLETEADALAALLADAGTRRGALVGDQLTLRDRIAVLRPLAGHSARRPVMVQALSEAERAFAAANELSVMASTAASSARREAERLRMDAVTLQSRIERIGDLQGKVQLHGEAGWDRRIVAETGVPTEALEADVRARDEEYWGKVSDSVLEDRRRRASDDKAWAESALAERGEAARILAGDLRLRPDALDVELRARRNDELHNRRDALLAEAGVALADQESALKAQRDLVPRNRQVYRELADDELPIDRADATRREGAADAESQRQQAAVTEAEREANEAVALRDAAKTRKDLLAVLADGLDTLAPITEGGATAAETSTIVPFAGSDEDARRVQTGVSVTLKTAVTRFTETERHLGDLVNALRQYATRIQFEAAGSLREVITTGDAADVGRRAGELAEQHHVRAAVLREDLKAISLDQEILVTDLAGQVRRVLDLLKKVPATSQMDRSLGGWGGKSFITIAFDDIAGAPDELARRVSAEVDAIVARGGIPDGLATLKKAVHAAVPGGFKVKVLKPTADFREERVPVSAMAKWSGGEKLTAAVVLYCIIARLRARNRTRELFSNSSGALILDNPLGKASYVGFLALQRRVAEALGVQLLYTTAVRDLKAVGTFPNVIRCRNFAPAGSDRGFVAAVERAGEAHGKPIDGLVSAARVVRLEPGAPEDQAEPEDALREPGPGAEHDVVA